jgi:hypothetical protein
VQFGNTRWGRLSAECRARVGTPSKRAISWRKNGRRIVMSTDLAPTSAIKTVRTHRVAVDERPVSRLRVEGKTT